MKSLLLLLVLCGIAVSQNCGCASDSPCCSQYGYCGSTAAYCDPKSGCKSGCWGATSSSSAPTPTSSSTGNTIFVGYYADWMADGDASCSITPEQVPATRYTHINYAFASFDGSGNLQNLDANFVKRVTGLKSKNPSLKVMASVGGGGFGSNPWTNLINNANALNNFMNSAKGWTDRYGFDGIDIDWEFPADGQQNQVADFFRRLRQALGNGKLLTSAGPSSWSIGTYAPDKWAQYVDFINVMNYDYFGSWSTTTGPLAPLYGTNTIDTTMLAYLQRGVPASKLVFGFANYGYTWTVDGQNGNYKPARNPGTPGRCTKSAGYLGALEIEALLKNPPAGFQNQWDSVAQVPFATWGNQFLTYDNKTSIDAKIKYIKAKKFAGGMLWLVDQSTTISDYIWSSLQKK